MKFGLSENTVSKIIEVLTKNKDVQKIILYGSRAKGTHREASDIDLTIIAPKLDLTDLMKLETELDDLLIPYKIDLSLFHKIENENLIDHINRSGIEFK